MNNILKYFKEAMMLDENKSTRVKSALLGDSRGNIKTFAILTAENPAGVELTNEENNILIKDLKNVMSAHRIQYIPIGGHFGGNEEHSFLLINLTLKDATYLSSMEWLRNTKEGEKNYPKDVYYQKSFFYGKTNKITSDSDRNQSSIIGYYETSDNGKSYPLIEESDNIIYEKDAKDFFSRHGDYKFSISMKCFESFPDVKDMEMLEKSLNEKLTSKWRARYRAYAYNGSRLNRLK